MGGLIEYPPHQQVESVGYWPTPSPFLEEGGRYSKILTGLLRCGINEAR